MLYGEIRKHTQELSPNSDRACISELTRLNIFTDCGGFVIQVKSPFYVTRLNMYFSFNVVFFHGRCTTCKKRKQQKNNEKKTKYSRLSLSRTPRDSLKYFEISVVRHIRFAELRKK